LQNQGNRNLDRAVKAGVAAAEASVFAADAPRSMAEMAQRDLDAALQLLAFRAQYITGASGAAIALRREGRNDMLCRASTGSSAPELGALLSTEYGLSGESVRTRQLMRCDDAERDARVNREVCRRLGISSVVVMPVVGDDGVLGVFELFSGKAHAFGERDVSAVQRLSEMVETAVRLAQIAQTLPERLKADPIAAAKHSQSEEKILDVETNEPRAAAPQKVDDEQIIDVDLNDSGAAEQSAAILPEKKVASPAAVQVPPSPPETRPSQGPSNDVADVAKGNSETKLPPIAVAKEAVGAQEGKSSAATLAASAGDSQSPTPAKPLFWSAAEHAPETQAAQGDESHVPPVLRGLRKCDACGFPISGGRLLCVECEEKKWRGQLKQTLPTGAIAAAARRPEGQAFAAAAPASGTAVTSRPRANMRSPSPAFSAPKAQEPKAPSPLASQVSVAAVRVPEPKAGPQLVANNATSSPAPVFSAGLEPSGSWFSRNKYMLGALILIAAVITAVFFVR
jgi:GAF domain